MATFFSAAVAGSYYWGFLCGKQAQSADSALYDRLLANVSSHILIDDAMQIGRVEDLRPMIVATIESDFASVVEMYTEHGFDRAKHLRCSVSRRFRKMKEDGNVLAKEESLAGYPVDAVSNYLKTECPGAPSHDNWMERGEMGSE